MELSVDRPTTEEEIQIEDRPKTEEEIRFEEALAGRISATKLSKPQPTTEVPGGVTNDLPRAEVVQTVQPGIKIPRPAAFVGIPPGLESLLELDELLIHQKVDLVEVFTCWDTNNKYQITNNLGQQVFSAVENTDTCMRQCCSAQQGFVIHVNDNFGQEVMRVRRDFKCCAGCVWCADSKEFGYEVQVEAPVETVCGYIRQLKSSWKPRYMIRNAEGQDLFYMQGPACAASGICGCFSSQEYKIFTPDQKAEVAVISKQWSNIIQELCADADSFRATFPVDLAVQVKALFLATAFLIDFMYY